MQQSKHRAAYSNQTNTQLAAAMSPAGAEALYQQPYGSGVGRGVAD